jgi:CopG family nickel-responsive transcriptional regulator
MSLVRFSVSLDQALAEQFDRKIREERCPTRSKAVGDLIRKTLVEKEWLHGAQVAGAIVLVYDHHKPDLVRRLIDLQHTHHHAVLSTQHMHLDHDNCLEIVAVLGKPAEIDSLIKRLKAVKGLKHVAFAAATTGKRLS